MASGHWLHGLALLALTAALPPGAATAAPAPAAAACPRLSGSWAGPRFNDQRFIVMMIPHHDEAIAMAELAPSRARRPEVRALAQQIRAAQTAENVRMRLWYRQWYGTEVPAQSLGGRGMGLGMAMSGMGMSGMGMAGMGTGPEALRAASDFDRAFLERMIPHHRMGVMMASQACLVAQHPELRRLQGAMVHLQNQEIERMQSWYSQWYGAAPLR
ncbi:MAG: DUF305 domain-containing protein [Cyanobium sp.]|nr:DUF305 domain-containing protein [Cyanobium sp.]